MNTPGRRFFERYGLVAFTVLCIFAAILSLTLAVYYALVIVPGIDPISPCIPDTSMSLYLPGWTS